MTSLLDGAVTPTELILDHARRRVGAGLPEQAASCAVRLISPTCGDVISLALVVSNEGTRVAWEGRGCEVSQASASMLAELSPDLATIARFLEGMRDRTPVTGLGDAEALLSLAGNPVRAKCATLAWRAAAEAWETES
ncbi:iron-sulfur cluster assembly scaffold protein [Microbacteriaceae bacterium VKM Ac-2855]|nr:iron-sulfur cluster assembly scaffold protein [Microbacteriaceae bacterium VKM Ac-2855]